MAIFIAISYTKFFYLLFTALTLAALVRLPTGPEGLLGGGLGGLAVGRAGGGDGHRTARAGRCVGLFVWPKGLGSDPRLRAGGFGFLAPPALPGPAGPPQHRGRRIGGPGPLRRYGGDPAGGGPGLGSGAALAHAQLCPHWPQ